MKKKDLLDTTVLITAGPTREYIDPVRFISNPSTGKMGYALAREARKRGADVILISGPTQIIPPKGIKAIFVESALDMQKQVKKYFPKSNIVIGASAVSDFRPVKKQKQKIKKKFKKSFTLNLVKNPDILKDLGNNKGKRIIVGFAAQTDDILKQAHRKLIEKNLDLIVVNNVKKPGAGFDENTNIATIIDKRGGKKFLPKMSKIKLAGKIFDIINRM